MNEGTTGQEHDKSILDQQLQNALARIAELENEPRHVDASIDSIDFEGIRDRTLKKLKMGRQSAAGKAIDTFIKEVRSQESGVK